MASPGSWCRHCYAVLRMMVMIKSFNKTKMAMTIFIWLWPQDQEWCTWWKQGWSWCSHNGLFDSVGCDMSTRANYHIWSLFPREPTSHYRFWWSVGLFAQWNELRAGCSKTTPQGRWHQLKDIKLNQNQIWSFLNFGFILHKIEPCFGNTVLYFICLFNKQGMVHSWSNAKRPTENPSALG